MSPINQAAALWMHWWSDVKFNILEISFGCSLSSFSIFRYIHIYVYLANGHLCFGLHSSQAFCRQATECFPVVLCTYMVPQSSGSKRAQLAWWELLPWSWIICSVLYLRTFCTCIVNMWLWTISHCERSPENSWKSLPLCHYLCNCAHATPSCIIQRCEDYI